ncbi:MAG: VOC family protein [Actinomycetota bacterium]
MKDVQKEYERLKAAGMKFHCPPVHVEAKFSVVTVYGRDPFGNVIELEEVEGQEKPWQRPGQKEIPV